MPEDRWEHGSNLHWVDLPRCPEDAAAHPWCRGTPRYYGSGRDAIRALLTYGVAECGWTRVWIPSYMCQEVARVFRVAPLTVAVYEDDPRSDFPAIPAALKAGDVIFVVNTFAIRRRPDNVPAGVVVIEDHTHDPWSRWASESRADYCLASLRKTLPLPDGAVLWSPPARDMPPEATISLQDELSSAQRLAAAALKRVYLEGGSIEKAWFRSLFERGEELVDSRCSIAGMTDWARAMLVAFPVIAWRRERSCNWRYLRSRLLEVTNLEILAPPEAFEDVPFTVVCLAPDQASRAMVVRELVSRSVYSTVLWPIAETTSLPGIPASTIELSERVFTLHCDARYSAEDLERVSLNVQEVVRCFGNSPAGQ